MAPEGGRGEAQRWREDGQASVACVLVQGMWPACWSRGRLDLGLPLTRKVVVWV